ncbi:MAG: hypothetical protein WCK89_19075 [bacterium]
MTPVSHGMVDKREQVRGRLTVMRMIHFALVSGVILFGLVVFLLTRGKMTYDISFQNPMFVVAGALTLGNIAAGAALSRIYFKSAGFPAEIGSALQKYQVFVLIRASLIEGAAMFAAVITLVTCNVLPACLLALCAGALAFFRPSQREFVGLMRNTLGADLTGMGLFLDGSDY